MKVFKFYSEDSYWAYSGKTEEEAKNQLLYEFGEMDIDKTEEIPESEWDKRFIDMYKDNDIEKETWKVSIRDLISENYSEMIFTNESL